MLSASFSGPCRTAIIMTVYPSDANAAETMRTLRFAAKARKATTVVPSAEGADGADDLTHGSSPPAARRTAKALVPGAGAHGVLTQAAGFVAVRTFGPRQTDRVLLVLHGYPSSSSEWDWAYGPLTQLGFHVVAIDFPGFGHSPGTPLNSRSEQNLAPGGPVDIAIEVMDWLALSRFAVLGYDWGAGIALSMAQRHPKRVQRIVSFHPCYTEAAPGELARVAAPTLLLWVKTDQFHPLSNGRKLRGKIKNCQLTVMDCGLFEASKAACAYQLLGQTILENVAAFLSPPVAAKAAPAGATLSPAQAVAQLRQWIQTDQLPLYYAAFLGRGQPSLKPVAVRVFASLPQLTPARLRDDPACLVDLGLWAQLPRGLDQLLASPRYPPGRQVLVASAQFRADTAGRADSYMAHDAALPIDGEPVMSHRCTVDHVDGDTAWVRAPAVGGGSTMLAVPLADLRRWNDPHNFAPRDNGHSFEDKIFLQYDMALTKASEDNKKKKEEEEKKRRRRRKKRRGEKEGGEKEGGEKEGGEERENWRAEEECGDKGIQQKHEEA